MKRLAVVLILLLAFAGLADSAYITQHEVAGTPLICDIANLSGCNIVAASPYSHLFGIPLAEYGILFYGIVFALALLELFIYDRLLRRALQGLAIVGVIASAFFVLIQFFVIGALCIYRLASALIALCIFIAAGFIEPLAAGDTRPPSVPPPPAPFRMPPA